jgi:hypothetical protein
MIHRQSKLWRNFSQHYSSEIQSRSSRIRNAATRERQWQWWYWWQLISDGRKLCIGRYRLSLCAVTTTSIQRSPSRAREIARYKRQGSVARREVGRQLHSHEASNLKSRIKPKLYSPWPNFISVTPHPDENVSHEKQRSRNQCAPNAHGEHIENPCTSIQINENAWKKTV